MELKLSFEEIKRAVLEGNARDEYKQVAVIMLKEIFRQQQELQEKKHYEENPA